MHRCASMFACTNVKHCPHYNLRKWQWRAHCHIVTLQRCNWKLYKNILYNFKVTSLPFWRRKWRWVLFAALILLDDQVWQYWFSVSHWASNGPSRVSYEHLFIGQIPGVGHPTPLSICHRQNYKKRRAK